MPTGWERLSVLSAVGDSARVVGLSPALRGVERRRMLDLGLVPGTEVRLVRRAPGGDPVAYRIRGAVVALRREQADQIRIERLHDAGEAA
jgi:Fe2+ transport system protein FeoA